MKIAFFIYLKYLLLICIGTHSNLKKNITEEMILEVIHAFRNFNKIESICVSLKWIIYKYVLCRNYYFPDIVLDCRRMFNCDTKSQLLYT